MANFVLVSGIWLGGWAWRDVTKILREARHDVFPLTLTGLGERSHLASREVSFETHVADVINLIEYNELEEVYLVGHSYGGVVTTQVSDKIPEKIAKLIYVDSAPLPDGSAQIDFYEPEQRAALEKSVREDGDGWILPVPPRNSPLHENNLTDIDDAMWARFEKLATPQPFNVSLHKLDLKNPRRKNLPKEAIFCLFSTAQIKEIIESGAPLFEELAEPEFEFADLPTGHYPMLSRSRELAELLIKSVTR